MDAARSFRLFVYGTLLSGEPDADLLEGATALGAVRTAAQYHLVELGPNAALLEGGMVAVVGELYEVSAPTLARCDLKREHPVLYQRRRVTLEDQSEAYAYFLRNEQAIGRRRLPGGDWKARFAVKKPEAGPFVRWARERHRG
jgi:gamma-glutamylaminecyclotransferase